MSNSQTVSLISERTYSNIISSNIMPDDFEFIDRHKPSRLITYTQSSVLAFMLLLAPSSSMPGLEPWMLSKRRETSAVMGIMTTLPYRRITMAEARRIALSIMKEAEERRLSFAVEEARRYAIWESES